MTILCTGAQGAMLAKIPPSVKPFGQAAYERMHQEIERKFLVEQVPFSLSGIAGLEVEQGYLEGTGAELHLRVRRIDTRYVFTIKHGRGAVRTEVELNLDDSQFAALWPLTEGRRLQKTRYRIPVDGAVIDLDVYHGRLAGLMTAEVEFQTEEDARRFEPPAWFGPEVTDDPRYGNYSLACSAGLP